MPSTSWSLLPTGLYCSLIHPVVEKICFCSWIGLYNWPFQSQYICLFLSDPRAKDKITGLPNKLGPNRMKLNCKQIQITSGSLGKSTCNESQMPSLLVDMILAVPRYRGADWLIWSGKSYSRGIITYGNEKTPRCSNEDLRSCRLCPAVYFPSCVPMKRAC
jgi:hypothetical protein